MPPCVGRLAGCATGQRGALQHNRCSLGAYHSPPYFHAQFQARHSPTAPCSGPLSSWRGGAGQIWQPPQAPLHNFQAPAIPPATPSAFPSIPHHTTPPVFLFPQAHIRHGCRRGAPRGGVSACQRGIALQRQSRARSSRFTGWPLWLQRRHRPGVRACGDCVCGVHTGAAHNATNTPSFRRQLTRTHSSLPLPVQYHVLLRRCVAE